MQITRTTRISEPVLLSCLFLMLLVGRLFVANALELFQDEALYLWMGLRAPLGFSPHPPAIPFLARSGVALLGKTEMGIRLFSVLLTSLTLPVFYILARKILPQVALASTLLFASVPAYFAFGSILTPDGIQLFFWLCIILATWMAVESGRLQYWALAGALAGCGLYVKFILILYFPSLLVYLVLTSHGRKLLRTPGPYVTAAIAFLIFVPVAAWSEAQAGWPTLRYHLEERQTFRPPTLLSIGEYHGGHFAFYSPFIYTGALAAMVWSGVAGFRLRDNKLLFLFSFSFPTWLFFSAITLVTAKGLSREQWDALAYPTALIAASEMVLRLPQEMAGRHRWRVAHFIAAFTGLMFCLGAVLEATLGVSSALGASPLFTATFGSRSMARAADTELELLQQRGRTIFVGNSFVESVQFAFYGKREVSVFCTKNQSNSRYGLVTLLDNTGMGPKHLAAEAGSNALYVMEQDLEKAQKPDNNREAVLRGLFVHVEDAPPVDIYRSGKLVKRYRMYRCYKLQAPTAFSQLEREIPKKKH